MIVAVTRTAPARLPSALRYRWKPQVLISDVVTQLTTTPLARRVAVKLAKLIASGPGLMTEVVGSPRAGVISRYRRQPGAGDCALVANDRADKRAVDRHLEADRNTGSGGNDTDIDAEARVAGSVALSNR